MKKIIFFIIIIVSLSSKAQVTSSSRPTLDSSLVKDSSGKIYAHDDWKALMNTRNYSLKQVHSDEGKTYYIIYRLTEGQKMKRDSLAGKYTARAIKSSESNFFITGRRLDPFREKDMDRVKLSIDELKGKVIVLNFWFVGCPPCRAEIPELNKVVENYKDNPDVVFIAIALDNDYALRNYLKLNPFKYHIIENGGYIAQGKYGINLYPTNVVVDKHGFVRFHTSGVGPATIGGIKTSIEALINEN